MNIGIIGLPQAGKRTLFELLVGHGAAGHRIDPKKTLRGVAEVVDPRLDRLVALHAPKKVTRARLDVLLPPRIEEHAVSEGDIFRDLAEVEVFCHVVRAFEDQAIYHPSGSIDPFRDIDAVNGEFLLHDQIFVEKRLEKIEKDLHKRKDESAERERELMRKLRAYLEREVPLRATDLSAEEDRVIRGYPLLSRRAMVIVLNVSDADAGDSSRCAAAGERYARHGLACVQIPIRLESEIDRLETEAERVEFMRAMSVEDTALHLLTRTCIDALGLISFFTVGPNEARHWFVRRGSTAVDAAAKIHTDLARGFIRAEVIRFADLDELGGEEKVRTAGKLGVKGRDYVVEDGDILFIRFSV